MKQTYSLYPFIRTDKPNKQGLCYMYFRYTYKGEYKLISLKKSIKKEDWNSVKLEPKRICPNRVCKFRSILTPHSVSC
ncbi:MAG: Arm DNA-binding domain-containing protein [Bacteroidota bacterium]